VHECVIKAMQATAMLPPAGPPGVVYMQPPPPRVIYMEPEPPPVVVGFGFHGR